MSSLPLAGKHCAIIGATGVIGSAIAQTFAREGAVLSLLSRSALTNRHKLEPLLRQPDPSAEPATQNPRAHRFFNVDATDREALRAAWQRGKNQAVS